MNLLCIKDVVLENGETAFKRGEWYAIKTEYLPVGLAKGERVLMYSTLNELGFIHFLGENLDDAFMLEHFTEDKTNENKGSEFDEV